LNRFATTILFFIIAAVIVQVVPVPVCASIEVDEEEVVFRLDVPGASKVFLTGDFNNWNPKMDSMVKRGGAWELRLYLVPGKYRYMFVVDGENLPDPDNPNIDADGNTFFIFIEEEGVYSITYEVTDSGERKIDEKYTPYGALSAVAHGDDYGLFTASTGMKGEIDGNIRGNVLVGFEYETGAYDPVKAYLLRAKGEWVTEKFSLGAFHRSGRIGFDDPLSLFTDVGPYAYPLDLFCRGAEASAGWKNSFEGRVFFANRIDGYRSSLDRWYEAPGRFPARGTGPWDKDMIGLSLKGVIGPVLLEYMYRHDRGPNEEVGWQGMYYIQGRHGIRDSHGLLLELRKKDYPVLRAQYLTGQTSMKTGSAYSFPGGEPYPTPSDFDFDMEEGYKALADISYSRGPFSGMLGWHRTTIDRNPSLLNDRYWESAMMDVFEVRAGYETGSIKIDLGVELEDFSGDGGTGRTFWLQGLNFWLDGDRLRTEMLQFLHSENVWKAELLFEEKGVDQIPGPFRLEGYLSASARWDSDTDRSNFEISGGKGIKAGQYLSFHTDLRYVSYSDDRWTGDSGFLDVWLGMRASLAGSGWVAWGLGVAPHRFDRWYFDFTGDGREEYLIGNYLFDSVAYGEDWWIDELERAEKSLAENWRLSFEGGFSF
jgi:hypothetical protein